MPHEILQQAEIVPLVAQGIAGTVAQHVGITSRAVACEMHNRLSLS